MIRNRIKNLVADVLYRTGLAALLIRRIFRRRMVVLTYHRVLPSGERQSSFSHDAIMVEPATFDRHLAVLNRHFTCLSLDEFEAALRCGPVPGKPGCLITFDDAWQDNYTHAFPILKRWGTPAVIFVPTDYIETGRLFWQERLGHFIDRVCSRLPDAAARLLGGHGWAYLAAAPEGSRRDEIKTAVRAIKDKEYAEIDGIVADLSAALGHDEPEHGADRYLSTEQMREMMTSGIVFQSHGCSHRILPRLPADELGSELELSRRWLREHLQVEPIALAYPNGDHAPAVQERTAQAGYRLAFTTIPGRVDGASEPLAIRRININDNAACSEARLLMTLLLSSR